MKLSRILIIVSLFAFANAGCASRESRAYSFRVLLTAVVNDTVRLRTEGKLTDAQFSLAKASEKLMEPVPDLLDSYAAGEPLNFEKTWANFQPRLSALIKQIAGLKKKPSQHSTGETTWPKTTRRLTTLRVA